ncbi:MAG: MEDS domain-containing protein [Nitrospira sp.]|nr:MEDS domain-containing protein [Nitrospira sp.]
MSPLPRHRCLIYKGPLTPYLPGISAIIRQKLTENYRCLYLDGPSRVAGTHPYLLAAGIDVVQEVAKGSLVLSSDNTHLMKGRFNVDRMLGMLEQALKQALSDGYQGLWTTGDMSVEFGPEKDFSTLLDYEWRLEEFLQAHPALCGICQYHADTLPSDALRHGLLTHRSLYINETLSRINPYYVEQEAFTVQSYNTTALDTAIRDLCTMPDALILNSLPPGYLQ